MRWRVPDCDIELIRGNETKKAYYHGLQVCSNPWACPVCGRKIRERRKVELQTAIAQAKAMGWHVYLVTLTSPHRMGDDLKTKIDLMEKAARKLSSDRACLAFRKMIGLEGTVRAWENTYGENGHHPHFHFLYFLKPMGYTVGPKDVEFGLCNLWKNACVKVGLPCPSDAHGCRVDGGDHAANYVSKGNWGLVSEMSKGFIMSS
jgi:plasmid rolling circle replication initiator protein Rep